MIFGNRLRESPEISLKRQELQLTREISDRELADREDHAQLKEERNDLVRWQQDLEDDLTKLRYNLLNYIYNFENNTWEPEKQKIIDKDGKLKEIIVPPLLNYNGVAKMTSLVKQYLSRNVMMSNLKEEIIFRMMIELVETIVLDLGMNYDNYDPIKERRNLPENDLNMILKMIKDTVEPTLYRAWNNGERNHLNTINKRIENLSVNQLPQKKSLFGRAGG